MEFKKLYMRRRSAVLISMWPCIEGAMDDTRRANMLGRVASSVNTESRRGEEERSGWRFITSTTALRAVLCGQKEKAAADNGPMSRGSGVELDR